MNSIYTGLFCLSVFNFMYAADVCFTGSHHEWCQYGCCDNRCCAYTTMAIVGAVFGGLVLIATLVACGICIYCMCKKPQNSRGTIVHPTNSNSVYVHNSAYGHPPPSYNQYSAFPASRPPPYSDPVFPPGTVSSSTTSNTGHPPPAYT